MKAILLAAGVGTRFGHLTHEMPKPLVRVDGTPIIERQIQLFLERGVTDIVVVTGHRHEQIDELTRRYPGVRLVHNDRYADYSNIYSMYLVRDELGDSYVSEADVLMHWNYVDAAPARSQIYGGRRRGFEREWVLRVGGDGRIHRVDVQGGEGVIMAGLSYWTQEDGARLRAALEQRIAGSAFAGMYWDEIPISLLDEMPVFLREIDPTDWSEINTPADLEEASERARQRRRTLAGSNWRRIWDAKRAEALAAGALDDDATLDKLISLDGYSAETARVSPDDWNAYAQAIVAKIDVRPGDSLFEVGCGSGAFLYPFHRMGCVTDGIDYSGALIQVARATLPGGDFTVGEAMALDPEKKYDFVLSNGVFQYFPSLDYAGEVLSRMTEKARRSVCALDVTDKALEEEGRRVRRASFAPGEYEQRFAGLDHLYYPRSWFEDFAARRGLSCVIEPQFMPNYVGRSFRFNVYLGKPSL